jgi:hypothetical protein
MLRGGAGTYAISLRPWQIRVKTLFLQPSSANPQAWGIHLLATIIFSR